MDLKHIHPDDVTDDGVLLPRFVVRIAQAKSPKSQYDYLCREWPEAMVYAENDEPIPLSVVETWPEPPDDGTIDS